MGARCTIRTQLAEDRASQRLLKRALLLWDELHFIVPYENFTGIYSDRNVAEAVELIGKRRVPSDEEKKEAHEQIEEIVTRRGISEAFLHRGNDPYKVYPQKFMRATWSLLMDSRLSGGLDLDSNDYVMDSQVGLVIMAILADAGEVHPRRDRQAPRAGSTPASRLCGETRYDPGLILPTCRPQVRRLETPRYRSGQSTE